MEQRKALFNEKLNTSKIIMDKWYVLSNSWKEKYIATGRPPPVDNSSLLCKETGELRTGLQFNVY